MGCRKLSYYKTGEGIDKTAFFSGGRLEKKEGALKNRYNYYPFGLTFNSYKREFSKKNKMNTFQDQEYDEETGWVQFKWRNHQPELGRFFNVDPLAEDYVYNSPYAFSENRVIDGIELEGLEFVKANDAKVYISNGSVKVNTKNLSYTTQQVFRSLNSNTNLWGSNSVGVDTRIKSFERASSGMKLSSSPNREGRMKPFENQGRLKIGVSNNRFGIADQRYKQRSLSFFTPSSGANRAAGLIQLLLLVKDEAVKANWNSDKSEIIQHLSLAMQSINAVQDAYDDGAINLPLNGTPFDNDITEDYLYKIADYVYRGTYSEDETVRSNGELIWSGILEKMNESANRTKDE